MTPGCQRPRRGVGTPSSFSLRAMAAALSPALVQLANLLDRLLDIVARTTELDALRLLHRERVLRSLTDQPALELREGGEDRRHHLA